MIAPPGRRPGRGRGPGPGRAGSTLVEIMIVALLIGIFAAMAVPSYRSSVEQARTDMAAANLRTLWAAQRLFFLNERHFTADPAQLIAYEVLQPSELQIPPGGGPFRMYNDPSYTYELLLQYDGSFRAVATRSAGTSFSGSLAIDASGSVTGEIVGHGKALRPGFR